MVEGCNLFNTEKDVNEISESLEDGQEYKDIDQNIKEQFLEQSSSRAAEKYAELLNNGKTADKAVQQLVDKVEQTGRITRSEYKQKFSEACKTVIKHTPDSLSFFDSLPSYRGSGNAMVKDLGHKTRGDAYAFEVIGTSILINREVKASNMPGSFKINDDDRIDYHVKLQARYSNFSDEKIEELNIEQAKRKTVEGDAFIHQPIKNEFGVIVDEKVVGIDFKHSIKDEYGNYSDDQLKGIVNALKTGEINEFVFASNVKFPDGFKKKIEEMNQKLEESRLEEENSHQYRDEYLTEAEKSSQNQGRILILENMDKMLDSLTGGE